MRRLYVTLAGTYVLLRVGAIVDAAPVATFPDSREYLAVAHHSLLSAGFWAGPRGPAVPLLYKLLPSDHLREIGQLALSIVAWLGLAAALSRSLRAPAVRVGAFVALLVFSLSPWIVQWDPLVLSESLSLSLTAALVAVWLELIRAPSRAKLAALVALALLWATARDPNGYVLLCALVVPAAWLVRSRERRIPAAVLAGLLVAAGAGIAASNGGERWKVPLVNVIGHRVLRDDDAAAMFHSRGMPQPAPPVEQALRAPGFIDHERLRQRPGWADFDRWLDDAGRQTYVRYLAAHPGDAIATTFGARRQLFDVHPPPAPSNYPLADYRPLGMADPLPHWLTAVAFPPAGVQLLVLLAALAAASMALRRRGAITRFWTLPAALVALAVPHALVVALGDTSELSRHALLLIVSVRLAAVVAAVHAVDAVALLREAPGRRTRRPSGRAYARP